MPVTASDYTYTRSSAHRQRWRPPVQVYSAKIYHKNLSNAVRSIFSCEFPPFLVADLSGAH